MRRSLRFSQYLLCLCFAGSLLSATTSSTASAQQVRPVPPDHVERAKKGMALFKSDVRDILLKNCFDCHGGKSVKGDFNLATQEKLAESGFVGETADDSQLIAVVAHTAEPHMPFKLPKLADAEIEKLRVWVNLGAPYDMPLGDVVEKPKTEMQVTDDDRKFWSFQGLSKVPVPEVTDKAWGRNPIDNFILAKQEAAKLHPNPVADRRILIRRAYMDLIGLPPTPEEVDAFLNDTDPKAWENLIDRLLASPHYGERWARHWIDVARFAESHGYEQDYDRPTAYHYRDFLIKALNSDLPYDKFVQWQLAGDELNPQNPMAMMATGFLGAGAFPTQLTEAEFESARYDELDDMVMTTGVAFLGLSVGCARCHDHKYDPIPARDYYSLAATFSTAIRTEMELDLDHEENQRKKEQFEKELALRRKEVEKDLSDGLPVRFRQWLKDNPSSENAGVWETLHVTSVASNAGTEFSVLPDGSVLATSKAPAKEVITVVGEVHRRNITALRLEALTHDSFPLKGPGRAGNGNFALGNIRLEVIESDSAAASKELRLVDARATHEQNTGSLSVKASIDDDPVNGWAVDAGGIGKDQAAVFDLESPVADSEHVQFRITLAFNHPNAQHVMGHFRLSFSDRTKPAPEVGAVGPDGKVSAALASVRAGAKEDSEDWKTCLTWFGSFDATHSQLLKAVNELESKGPPVQRVKALITSEGLPHLSHHADDRGFPHFYPEVHLLKRGDVHQKQEVVSAGFLQALSPAGKSIGDWKVNPPEGWTRTSFRRATLAHWMTDVNGGAGSLAARVMVNRLWQHHFGRGIVSTPNDFGVSGERPSHPELLEWLANDLVQNGWTLKRMHRLIMTSQTYMQSSAHDEERASIDRENTLLWRRSPKRLEGEAIRDSLLAVSGKLDRTQFGPGTLDQNMTRRSVYFFIKRSQLIPMMMLFDWPEHLVSIGQRPVTTIAPQSLMFMNSAQGRDYAASFASRLNASDPVVAIQQAWRMAFGRKPSDQEVLAAKDFLTRQTAAHTGASDSAYQALIDLCQTIFSMNEFVYIE